MKKPPPHERIYAILSRSETTERTVIRLAGVLDLSESTVANALREHPELFEISRTEPVKGGNGVVYWWKAKVPVSQTS
jgi:hypothetical protein